MSDASTDPLALLDALPDPVIVLDTEARVCWANVAMTEWSGWVLDEWRGRAATSLVHPDDLATALESLSTVQRKQVGTAIDIRLLDRWGRYHRFEARGRSALDREGVEGIVVCLRDVTDRRRWEIGGGSAPVLQAILDHAGAVTMLLDVDGRVRSASRAFTNLLGHGLETTLGTTLPDLAAPADRARLCDHLRAAASSRVPTTVEALLERAGGRDPIPMSLTVVNLLDDLAVEGLVVTAIDISALVEARSRLQHLATHDPLTGLPNRALFLDRLDAALASARRHGRAVGVIYADVDGFKSINDTHGHPCGDAVLVRLARRLQACVRDVDTVARISGDEFVVVVDDATPEVLDALLDRIHHALQAPFPAPGGRAIRVSLSCGVASSDGSADVEAVLVLADQAMYRSKHRRTGHDVPA